MFSKHQRKYTSTYTRSPATFAGSFNVHHKGDVAIQDTTREYLQNSAVRNINCMRQQCQTHLFSNFYYRQKHLLLLMISFVTMDITDKCLKKSTSRNMSQMSGNNFKCRLCVSLIVV